MCAASVYPVSPEAAKHSLTDEAAYRAMYQQSVINPDGFWREQAKRIDWIKPFTKVKQTSFDDHHVDIKWFADGTLNLSANCLDRHLETRGDQIAIIWEGDNPAESAHITYNKLHHNVSRLANVLKSRGVKKGDRVCIYMPMIPEAAYAMLACARIGAIHSVVFGGFSPDALRDRILDADCRTVITADEGVRGGKYIPLKNNVDKALQSCPNVSTVVVVERTQGDVAWVEGRDLWYHQALKEVDADCPAEPMDAEDPLFILYTSGSTGKPKGVLHTTGGYLLGAAMTHKYVFDYHEGDVYWCTADVGWVTGHSYVAYAPLVNGATQVIYEGTPDSPHQGRWWEIVQKYGVSILYTAPTAIRTFMKWGRHIPDEYDLSSLRVLGSVGEAINPEAWRWYHEVIGAGRCPIVDTWWQTETGAHMLTPLPGVTTLKPGSAQRPVPGVVLEVVDELGEPMTDTSAGFLVVREPWPSMLRGIWGDRERFKETYWSRFPGMYFAGDGARYDEDGDIWLLGRVDDVMNVSGHRLSTTEIESSLVAHPSVAESAVVGAKDETTGEAVVAFVLLTEDAAAADRDVAEVEEELRQHVGKNIGPIAKPKRVLVVPELPKTRSGKIMRRLLKDVAEGRDPGDSTTLADPTVMQRIVETLAPKA